ncbi:CBS domain-containing protein (plasmid) [Rhizobium sp. CB3090]|uniref:CBS domain-containing protein n=1 Tax=Rhizobium sp. CB3090 TaxID=3039156 RepID=UPI0024B23BD4|nr:CBS domain-containing protein [Rhizobium sp. CB3090]WFU13426.1 CBS domain-containing protein [Rhizobium sp. CB3090]
MLVRDIMTSTPVTVKASSPIAEAASLMLDNRISGLPVVDDDGTLIGIVSEGDFLRRGELDTERRRSCFLEFLTSPGKLADEYVHAHGRKVEEVMTSSVTTVSPQQPIADAVKLMERDDIKRLPVVEDDQLIGIVARSDLMRALFSILMAKPALNGDAQIEAAIQTELAKHSWSGNGFISVAVKDGVAELSGTIFDERERLAAKVAAENVPGVKSVTDQLTWIDPYYGVAVPLP